jgi:hypothetical protein
MQCFIQHECFSAMQVLALKYGGHAQQEAMIKLFGSIMA